MNEERTEYEKLTPSRKLLYDAVMRNLESGNLEWLQGWTGSGAPVSAISGKSYNGLNRLSLILAASERGYSDNRWMTYKQMEDKGWSFKRNAEGRSLGKNTGVTIEYFELRDKETKRPFDRHILDGMTADERNEYMEENVYPLRKYYRVFNGDVIEGIPALERRELDKSGYNARAENLIGFWSNTECPIRYGGSMAYYNIVNDEIHLPRRENFIDLPEYYSTALHEIGHSTGAEKRLNREMTADKSSPSYAMEELRAELASMFIEQDLGVEVKDKHIQNNSAYIGAWKSRLKEEPDVLFKAIADAERITKFVMSKEKAAQLAEIEEEQSDIFMPPSVIAAALSEGSSKHAVDMSDRGVDSLTRMEDRELVERASNTKQGAKFSALFNGFDVLGSEEKNERSLMARLAVHTSDREKLLRVFKASGQYRDEKPNAYYEKLADEELRFVAGLKKQPAAQNTSHASKSGRFAKAKG